MESIPQNNREKISFFPLKFSIIVGASAEHRKFNQKATFRIYYRQSKLLLCTAFTLTVFRIKIHYSFDTKLLRKDILLVLYNWKYAEVIK
jgi:hypothetical protein